MRPAYPSLLFSADRRVLHFVEISTRKVSFCMKITYSIPKDQLKKKGRALEARLSDTLSDVGFSLDKKQALLVLETAPDADPIAVAERLRTVFAALELTATRVANAPDTPTGERERPKLQLFDKKPPRVVKMSQYVISLVAMALICSVVMFLVASMVFSDPADAFEPTLGVGDQQSEDFAAKIAIIDSFFKEYALKDVDGNLLLDEMLRAYVKATGDDYAAYYTEEEYNALMYDMQGENVGVGITVTMDPDTGCIYVIQVANGSPAQKAGVLPGDLIVAIGTKSGNERVSEIGYDAAMQKLLGAEGTDAKFIVLRDGAELEFVITRAKFTADSVKGQLSTTDPKVGIVRISGFEANTPAQFKAEMKKLLDAGCERFVYDVRNNPGGELRSVCAVLSYFAEKDSVLVTTEYKNGDTEVQKAVAVSYTGDYAACSVAENEIGMFRRYPCVVLANGHTASAGELFTAALRDFGLADVVGENTFGKGVIQSIFPLSALGEYYGVTLSGGLKLTVGYYTPPCGENYDGKGIAPTGDPVALPEDLQNQNLYLLSEQEDVQLLAAIQNVTAK